MPMVSDETFQWAKDCFEAAIEALLDDPSSLCHQFREFENVSEEFAAWRALATDLGMDFDVLVEKHGSDYEKQRLRDIEAGVIPAAPRQEAAFITRLRELSEGYNFADSKGDNPHTEGYVPFLPSRRRVSGDEPFSFARVAEAMPLPSARDNSSPESLLDPEWGEAVQRIRAQVDRYQGVDIRHLAEIAAMEKLKVLFCPVHYSSRLLPSGVRVCQNPACDWTDAEK